MIIDFHTHVVPPRIKQNREQYALRDSSFAAIYSNPKAKMATTEDLIGSMDKNGVSVSVLLNYSWSTQSLCVEINDYILESVAKYPQRLAGFCNARLAAGDRALKEIERCLKAGACGVGEIRPDLLPEKNMISLLRPVTGLAGQYDAILLVHSTEPVGHRYPGKGAATPETLYQIITAFPDLKIVCAHWGGGLPFYALMPEVKESLKNVYFDTAASPFLYRPEIYRQVIDFVGVEKILFGTDYPLLSPGRYLKEIDSLELTANTRAMIQGGNAAKVLGIT